MYSMKNKDDIQYIIRYHRANDMINIIKFFPDLSPVDDLAVVVSEEDYLRNKDKLTNLTSIRNGNPITQVCMKSIPVKEHDPDILEAMRQVKEENKDGVLILFHLNVEKTERYERYAGISVAISLGHCVYIEAVGKGFDGREVLKGISCHERYMIPWYDLMKVNGSNFKDYNTFVVSDEAYQESREERINYLVSCGLERYVLEKNIPKTYSPIPDFIWLDIIKNILKVLQKEEEYLRMSHFEEFNLSGHTEGKRFRPWQMASSKRM